MEAIEIAWDARVVANDWAAGEQTDLAYAVACHAVGSFVGSVKNNRAECIEPIGESELDR